MTVIGIDDTDSRTAGMCTTYAGARLVERVEEVGGRVERALLVRLNPAVEHKTRGNGAVAIHCTLPPDRAFELAEDVLSLAVEGEQTSPGAVVWAGSPSDLPAAATNFSRAAIHEELAIADAVRILDQPGFRAIGRQKGRGRIGALAAVGAWAAFETEWDWSYECLSYRPPERWGTDRVVDEASVFAAAAEAYPTVWDTVDRAAGEAVCVPHAPGPVLYGIRGDEPDTVCAVADAIDGEPVARRQLYVTNQGTDAHLQPAALSEVADGGAYRLTATVTAPPETREGGHVFFAVGEESTAGEADLRCVAFEPTKRFRDRVRALRVGDRVTVCGEIADGTLKLEKFALREPVRTELVTPDCPECGRSMSSAGRAAGYRCRDCGTTAPGRVERPLDRAIEPGWYEVPPRARRHVARPLVRGGFDAPTHPER